MERVKAFKPHLAELPYYPYEERQAPIKLDQNESPYDLPQALKSEVAERLKETPLNRYPAMDAGPIKKAIAAFEGWPVEGVVVSPGSNAVLSPWRSPPGGCSTSCPRSRSISGRPRWRARPGRGCRSAPSLSSRSPR